MIIGVKCPSIVFLHLYQFVTSRWTHVQQNRIKKMGFWHSEQEFYDFGLVWEKSA